MGDKQVKKCKQRFSEETIEEWRNMTKGMKKKHMRIYFQCSNNPKFTKKTRRGKRYPKLVPKLFPRSLQVVSR